MAGLIIQISQSIYTVRKRILVSMKSPLKSVPLQPAGQSAQYKIIDSVVDGLFFYSVAVTFVVTAINEWRHTLIDSPPSPWLLTTTAAIVCIFCGYKIRTKYKTAQCYKQGREGELSVAEILNKMVRSGCHVMHDIPCGNFNIDHLVISKQGFLIIETKTPSKYGDRNTIESDGKSLKINKKRMKPNPLDQLTYQKRYLKNQLEEFGELNHPIQPIVVFPDWFVEDKSGFNHYEPWALNPKGVEKMIKRLPDRLTQAEIDRLGKIIIKLTRDSNSQLG